MTAGAKQRGFSETELADMRANSGGMGGGMMLLIGLFVVLLICAGLGGAYMLLNEDGGGRDSFVDLEAGRGPRRPQKSELEVAKRFRKKSRRRKPKDQNSFLPGEDIGRSISRSASRRHRSRRNLSAA